MANTNKKFGGHTNADFFQAIIDGNIETIPEAQEWALHQLELLKNKKERAKENRKEAQKENEAQKEQVYNLLKSTGKHMDCTEIGANFGLTSQKISPMVQALKKEGRVDVEVVKGKNLYFAI